MSVRVAYVILAHADPQNVARLAKLLLRADGVVVIHYDRSSSVESFQALRQELGDDLDRVLWAERAKAAWGQWGIVQGTLNALKELERSKTEIDYVHLLSGSDYPIRPLGEFKAFLARSKGTDFIECVDLAADNWVKGGLTHERYQYRHYFNYMKQEWLFDSSVELHRRFGRKRQFPEGLCPHLGSQWWTLSWRTCCSIIKAAANRRLVDFFKTVWIPDEMFIQSVVGSIVGGAKKTSKILTLYQFSSNGKPLVYYNGHHKYLERQPFFFARKISPYAGDLRDKLDKMVVREKSCRVFTDDAIGKRTDEYEVHQAKVAVLQPNTRLIGYVEDARRRDLAHLNSKVLVVVGASREELEFVQKLLNQTGVICCHGVLFDHERIGFNEDAEFLAGYSSDAVELRNYDKESFLLDVVNASLPLRPAFLNLKGSKEKGIIDRLFWVPAVQFLIVRGNIWRAFLEQKQMEEERLQPKSTSDRMIAVGKFSAEVDGYYDWVAGKCRESGSLLCEIDLLDPAWLEVLNKFLVRGVTDSQSIREVSVNDVKRAAGKLKPLVNDEPVLLSLLSHALPKERLEAHLAAFEDTTGTNLP